jgi:hypothetical protein
MTIHKKGKKIICEKKNCKTKNNVNALVLTINPVISVSISENQITTAVYIFV